MTNSIDAGGRSSIRGMRFGHAAILVLLITAASTGARENEAGAHAPAPQSIIVGGHERRYFTYGSPEARRVVLVLHGTGGDAERIRAFTARRFERLADEQDLMVIYPEGYLGSWNDCRRNAPAKRLGIDDLAFLRGLLGERPFDAAFAFGFSGGAHMVLRLAIEAPELLLAAVMVGASIPEPEENACRLGNPGRLPAMMLINGDADPINPYNGGEVSLPLELGGSRLGRVLSSRDSAAWLASRAGHAVTGQLPPETRAHPAMTRLRWQAADRPDVELVTVLGGGHSIPMPGTAYPPFVGRHRSDIDAVSEAWRFFSARNLPGRE